MKGARWIGQGGMLHLRAICLPLGCAPAGSWKPVMLGPERQAARAVTVSRGLQALFIPFSSRAFPRPMPFVLETL